MAQNGDLFDSTGLKQIFQMLLDQSNNQPETLAKNAVTDDILKVIRETAKDSNKITEKEVDKVTKTILTELRTMFGGNAALTSYVKLMTELLKDMANRDKGLNEVEMTNRIIASLSNMFQASYDAKRSGQGTVLVNYESSKAKGDSGAQKLIATFIPQHLVKINSAIEKVLDFWNEHRAGEKARQRRFVDDLVEGLAKSKWVGGVLMDLVKLASYFAASWLKQFGTLGKVLAVGVIAAAPLIGTIIANVLTKALVGGITNVLKAGLLGLGTLLKATFMSFTNRELLTSTLRGAPTVAKGSITNGSLAVGSFLAAGAVGMMAADSFKQGDTRNKWAGGILGLGSLGFGAAGLASSLAPLFPLLAPIAPIALAVAAVATGVGMIVKFWPQIVGFFEKILQWLGIMAKEDEKGGYKGGAPTVFENLNKDFSGEKGVNLKSRKEGKELSAKELEAWNRANFQTEAKVGADGAILNFGQMTQQRAGLEMERIRKENPEAWDKLYEYIPFEGVNGKIYGNKSDFGTDLISPDGKGFYAAKGSMARMDAANAYLESKGYQGAMQFTGGIATAGNFETLQASPHKLKGHDSPYAAKFDIGQRSINQVVNNRGQRASLALIDEAIKSEGAWSGATVRNEGDHRDVYWVSGDIRSNVREGKEAKKETIEAARKSIAVLREDWLKEEQEAKKDGKITEEEDAAIKERYSRMNEAKADLVTLEKENPTSFSLTGMKQLRNKLTSRTAQDLIDMQVQAMQQY